MCPTTQLRNQAVPWSDVLPDDEAQATADEWPDEELRPGEAATDLAVRRPSDDAGSREPVAPPPVAQRATPEELAALLARVMRQDEAALAEVYACLSGAVYTVALRFTRRVDLAEEVLQDTFWQVWRQAPRFDPARGAAAAWIMTIARSRAMDAARAVRRTQTRESSASAAEVIEQCGESAGDPLDLLCDVRRDTLVHRALSRLDPMKRQLVTLAFFRGLTQEDIAEHTGLPLGTVKSHMRRTLAALREALGGDGGIEDLGRRA